MADNYNKIITTLNSVSSNYTFIPDQDNVIVIDTSNNRIGINTVNPEHAIDVCGGTIKSNNLIIDNTASIYEGSFNKISSNLIPNVDNVHSLGDASNQWHSLFVGPGSIYLNQNKFISLSGDKLVIDFDGTIRFPKNVEFEEVSLPDTGVADNNANIAGGYIYNTQIGKTSSGFFGRDAGHFTDVTVQKLTVSLDTVLQGRLDAVDASFANIDISKNLNVLQDLNVTENTVLQGRLDAFDASFANIDISKNLNVLQDLTVTGTTTLGSSVKCGDGTTASGINSTAFGYNTTASGNNSFVCGKHNESDSGKIFIIGGGTDYNNLKNLITVDYSGNMDICGSTNITGHTQLSDVSCNNLNVTQSLSVAANTDSTHTLGNMLIGNIGFDYAVGFKYKDVVYAGYGFLQTANGATYMSCGIGQAIYFNSALNDGVGQGTAFNWMSGNSSGVTITTPITQIGSNYGDKFMPCLGLQIYNNGNTINAQRSKVRIEPFNDSRQSGITIRDLVIGGGQNSGGLYLESQFIYISAVTGDPHGFKGNRNYYASSDDRMKFNETPITDGLEVINQLSVQKYDKVSTLGNTMEDGSYMEIGVIAQEMQKIPQLSHAVSEDEETGFAVSYTEISCYNVRATQELHTIVTTQAATISTLEAKLATQEATISTLEVKLATQEAKLNALEARLVLAGI
jgi:hypothetical protein